MGKDNLRFFWISCCLVSCVFAQIPEQLTAQNPCISKPNCHECIQTPSCAWCFDPKVSIISSYYSKVPFRITESICV